MIKYLNLERIKGRRHTALDLLSSRQSDRGSEEPRKSGLEGVTALGLSPNIRFGTELKWSANFAKQWESVNPKFVSQL